MVLYFSAGTESGYFRECQQKGWIAGGFQAQKFNQMMIEGLSHHIAVTAVGNPPFGMANRELIPSFHLEQGQIRYETLGCRPGKLRKLSNFRGALGIGKKLCRRGDVSGIFCDAVNPLAAVCSRLLSRRYGIPAVAVITDIPSFLSEHPSFFSRLAEKLMKEFDGYVLLTDAMNPIVNPSGRPHIIVEGLCDVQGATADAPSSRKHICLYTGSLSAGTGIENLIQAFSELSPRGYTLELYGGGNMAAGLTELPDSVIYGGTLTNDEAVRRQQESALLVNPRPTSLRYANLSFPSKIMEYMASGTPILTTRLPGIPGEYADYLYFAEDDSPGGLAAALEQVLALPEAVRLEKGRSARAFVLREKNNVRQTERMLELLARIPKGATKQSGGRCP